MIYYRKTLFGSGPKLTAVQTDQLNVWKSRESVNDDLIRVYLH